MDSVSNFLNQRTKSYYLSHAVRAISDHINVQMAQQYPLSNEQKNWHTNHFLRFFDIILKEKPRVIDGARVYFTQPERIINGKKVVNSLAVIEYSKSFLNDAKMLRLLIAHELAHIYMRHILEKYKCDRKEIERTSQEELDAWIIAIEIIENKDRHYLNAPNEFCHCCKNAIIESVISRIDPVHHSAIRALKNERCARCKA